MKFLLELAVDKTGSPRPGHDREIHPGVDRHTVYPEKLTNPALQAIAADGIADLAAYGNTQARSSGGTGECDHDKVGGVATLALPPGLRILPGVAQTAACW